VADDATEKPLMTPNADLGKLADREMLALPGRRERTERRGR
jgi:hypothetical protein